MISKRVVKARKTKQKAAQAQRDKKAGPSLDIFVNGTVLKWDQRCGFCETRRAAIHCPQCLSSSNEVAEGDGDFLCDTCDLEVHRHFKRMGHVRTSLPYVDADGACHRIVGLFRYVRCRKLIITACRERYERFFDPRTCAYYYCDMAPPHPSHHQTDPQLVTWRKPYCLGSLELAPFPTFDDCARRIQGCARSRAARNLLIFLITCNYERIYSREHTKFYYIYNGPSRLLQPRVSWAKPVWLAHRDLKPVKTEDVAALMIQSQWAAFKARGFMRDVIRQRYSCRTDPLTGQDVFTNRADHSRTARKPWLLGSHDHDPDDISRWDGARLQLWLRRLGFKAIVPNVKRFRLDGALLLAFEWQDYIDLGITEHHRIKRILLDIERRAFFQKHRDKPITIVRRDRLRYHHRIERAAIILQKAYRRRYARLERKRMLAAMRLARERDRRDKIRLATGAWWGTKLSKLPVPERGKLYGKQRAYDSVEGFGCWIGDRHVATDPSLRPRPVAFEYRKPTKAAVRARQLRFSEQRQDPEVQRARTKMHTTLTKKAEDLNRVVAAQQQRRLSLTHGHPS